MPEQRALIPEPTTDELGSLAQRDVADVPADKWARSLVEFVEQIQATFERSGMADDDAFRLASQAVRAIAEFRGGRQFYLPRGDTLVTALRDAEIYHRANRSNIETLAAEYGLTVSQIYRIGRQQRALHLRKVQGRLFDDDKGE